MTQDIFLKLNIYGDSEQGFSCSSFGEKIKGDEIGLKPCPRCASTNTYLSNTHTPYYRIKCECGIELDSSHISDDGNEYSDLSYDELGNNEIYSTERECKLGHSIAIRHIIDKWNCRISMIAG